MTKSLVGRSALALGLALAIGAMEPASASTATPAGPMSPLVALKLNVGKKWETDAPLRQAMAAIREALFADIDAVYLGRMDPPRYETLAKKVDARIAEIVLNCSISPEADAQLHLVLAQIMQGSVAMRGEDPGFSRRAGADRIVAALEAYSRHFDHPGWKALAGDPRVRPELSAR